MSFFDAVLHSLDSSVSRVIVLGSKSSRFEFWLRQSLFSSFLLFFSSWKCFYLISKNGHFRLAILPSDQSPKDSLKFVFSKKATKID